MSTFNQSLLDHQHYPKNLLPRAAGISDLGDYYRRLEKSSTHSFVPHGSAKVWFLELSDTSRGFISEAIETDEELKKQLRVPNPGQVADPICRYVFLEARSSRDPLKITKSMFTRLMTYHQIMPAFLDFVFSFQDMEYQNDFNFTAIRSEENLGNTKLAHPLPILRRSDRGIQFCYNLRSVERVPYPEEWPWSIRQAATASQFDTQTYRATWIVLKANSKLRRKLETDASSNRFTDSHPYDHMLGSFAAYLSTHTMVCEWARGHWALYITFLESRMQEETRQLTTLDIGKKTIQGTTMKRLKRTQSTPVALIRRQTTFASDARDRIRRAVTWRSSVSTNAEEPAIELETNQPTASIPSVEPEDWTFECLRDVHALEEKTNEALLIIRSNMSVMSELSNQVVAMSKHADFPEPLSNDKCDLVSRFRSQVQGIVSDLKLQEARAENLLQLLSNRKAMLSSLMDYETRVSAEVVAEKSQSSANKMEELTGEMRIIAKKTENETIFMRIVTVVTMFFLPGTFVSTLMSTDILRFEPDRSFSAQALKYYLIITIPLMAMTFFIAYGIRGFEQRRVDLGWVSNDPEKGKGS